MYCRRCGKKLDANATVCPYCHTEVIQVAQRPYAEKYQEKKEKERRAEKAFISAGKADNPYLNRAVGSTLVAFIISIFPWPVKWGIGTSLWMKIIVILLALCADYFCIKANQISNEHVRKHYLYKKPAALRCSNVVAVLTTLVSSFALFLTD